MLLYVKRYKRCHLPARKSINPDMIFIVHFDQSISYSMSFGVSAFIHVTQFSVKNVWKGNVNDERLQAGFLFSFFVASWVVWLLD